MKKGNLLIRFIKEFILPMKKQIIIYCFFMIFASLGELFIPMGVQLAIDKGIGNKNIKLLLTYIVVILVVAFLTVLIKYVQNYKITKLVKTISFNIKDKIFKGLQEYNLEFFSKHKAGEITSIIERDVEQIEGLATTTFLVVVVKSFTLIALLVTMFLIEWKVSIYVIVVSPMMVYLQYNIGNKLTSKISKLRQAVGEINDFTQESIENINDEQLLDYTSVINNKYEKKQIDLINKNVDITKISGLISVAGQLINILGIVVILLFSGIDILNHKMSVGYIMSLIIYVQRAYDPLLQIMQSVMQIQNSNAILERVYSLIDVENKIKDGSFEGKNNLRGEIHIKNLKFSYDEKKVFDNLCMHICSGKFVGIVGENGTGKSTIARILTRICEPERGEILFDGVDIRKYKLKYLREQVLYIPSNTYIFTGTIKENILLKDNEKFDMDKLYKIVELVGLKNDICAMEKGFDTILTPHAVNLSTGQCQKLSLARALVKNPSILILDEPTAALDLNMEKDIANTLKTAFEGKTVIIITHRTELLKICDVTYLINKNENKLVRRLEITDVNKLKVN